MPPKKAQKMSLNEFLGDSALGSWADEMDALPTAPSGRADDDRPRGDRRRDDYPSSRSERAGPPREDLPLPTEPPFTAFVGNLAFDITESELESFFSGLTKTVKIIKDREDKPKGFGYIEFNDLDGLKEALAKSGTTLAGRAIRVSVAEPQKERSGFGERGGFDDDPKFAGNWRRDGPLPDLGPSRDHDGPRRRFEGSPREPLPPSLADNASDWRSSRAPARASTTSSQESEGSFRRRGPGSREPAPTGAADVEENWHIGSKFRPSVLAETDDKRPGSRFGSLRSRSDMGPPAPPNAADEGDWRRAPRNSTSPNNSTPPTPQMARRKLELLPRSSNASATPSPLASPNPSTTVSTKSNPFGDAKPVDVATVEEEAQKRIDKTRADVRGKVAQHSMSRTSSRTGSQRPPTPASSVHSPTVHSPTTPQQELHKLPASNVRPSISFASAAAGKKDASEDKHAAAASEDKDEEAAIEEKVDEFALESSQ